MKLEIEQIFARWRDEVEAGRREAASLREGR